MNCWEFKKCGLEAGGANINKQGPCPAYPDKGKCCARVAGTLCNEEVQGKFAAKLRNCMKCDFYRSDFYNKSYEECS